MTNLPKNIVFDFGGVLLDIDLSLTINAFSELGLQLPDPTAIHPNNSGPFLALEKGLISTNDFLDTLQSYSTTEPKPSHEKLLQAWNALLLPYQWHYFELLDTLRERGHKIYLLSNTNQPHHIFFEERFARENPSGRTFGSYFDIVFYSDELKMRKPDREIYAYVEKEIGSNDILFIDDNAPNLVEPQKMGWQTLHKNPKTPINEYF